MAPAVVTPDQAGTVPCSDMAGLQKRFSGCEQKTTNNRMEMMAVIEALRLLKRPCRIIVTTDSQYVMKGMTPLDSRLDQEKLEELSKKNRF